VGIERCTTKGWLILLLFVHNDVLCHKLFINAVILIVGQTVSITFAYGVLSFLVLTPRDQHFAPIKTKFCLPEHQNTEKYSQRLSVIAR